MQPTHYGTIRATAESLSDASRLLFRLLDKETVRGHRFSMAKAVSEMSQEQLSGLERETLEETTRLAGKRFDRQRVEIPFALLTRDLTKGVAGAGGYLVSVENREAADILRPWSVTARAGVTVLDRLVGDQAAPKTTAKATPYWLATETSTITGSTPTIGQVAMTPKTAGALVAFSRQIAKQANAEMFVRRELLRTIGSAADQAVLNGSGASGQPTGITNTAGIGTQAGASLSHAGCCAMKRVVATANAPDEEIAFIGTPIVREVLETRERATGSGFIWDNDRVASRTAYATTDMPASTLIAGAWSAILLGIWGDGITVEINPYDPTGFKSGSIQARVLLSCDVAVLYPAAFSVATSVN